MQIILFDLSEDRIKLFPLTLTRPICHLRVGILTLSQKWALFFPESKIAFATEEYLQGKFGQPYSNKSLWINASVLPDEALVLELKKLKNQSALFKNDQPIAFWSTSLLDLDKVIKNEYHNDISSISRNWDIFKKNGEEIRSDYQLITNGRVSQDIQDPHTRVYGSDIFIEDGVSIKAAILNAENGPIYIGRNAEVQEGAIIRGPFSLGESSVVNMGAKIRGDTTIGPYSKAGGEISNSVIMGFSNKGHDGFLGNSVIGEWCNIGADTNNSNLKNNYSEIKMWDYLQNTFIDTGLQFCGLIMGDHSKTGINTMFNSGTTVGVSTNIFGSGFPRTQIPSFSWGGASGLTLYQIEKALETAASVMSRRNLSLTNEDKAILRHIFENHSSH